MGGNSATARLALLKQIKNGRISIIIFAWKNKENFALINRGVNDDGGALLKHGIQQFARIGYVATLKGAGIISRASGKS